MRATFSLAFSGFSVGCLLAYLFTWQPRPHVVAMPKGDKQTHLQFKDALSVPAMPEIRI